jgi:hypothetical protein
MDVIWLTNAQRHKRIGIGGKDRFDLRQQFHDPAVIGPLSNRYTRLAEMTNAFWSRTVLS